MTSIFQQDEEQNFAPFAPRTPAKKPIPLGGVGQTSGQPWSSATNTGGVGAPNAALMAGGATPGNAGNATNAGGVGAPNANMMASGPRPAMLPQTGVTTTSSVSAGNGNTNGTFGPTNNLISSQFNPTPSGRLNDFRSLADNAAKTYAGQGSTQNIDTFRTGMQTGLTSAQGAQPLQYKPLNYTPSGGGITGGGGGGGGASMAAPKMSADAERLRAMGFEDLEKVRGGVPDRGQLARESYDQLVERGQPAFDQQVRGLGQKTAALGRAGSGLYNSELADLATTRERDLDLSRRGLATDAAGQTLNDRMGVLDATRGVGGDVHGQDMDFADMGLRYASEANANSRFGAGMAADRDDEMYRRAAGERDFEYGVGRDNNDLAFRRGGFEQDTARDVFGGEGQYDDANFSRARSQASDLAGYGQDIEGSERRDREELRGEREFQYGADRDAIGDARDERMMQEDLTNSRFNRGMRLSDQGYSESPGGAYGGASDFYGGQGDQYRDQASDSYGAAGDLAGSYAARRAAEQQRLMPPRRGVPPVRIDDEEIFDPSVLDYGRR